MPKFAWIENNIVRDISFHPDPTTAYTPEIAAFYTTLVPDDTEIGMEFSSIQPVSLISKISTLLGVK